MSTPSESFGAEQLRTWGALALKARDLHELYWLNREAMGEYLAQLADAPLNVETFLAIEADLLSLPAPDFALIYGDKDVLLLQGEADVVVPWEHNGKRIAERLSGAEIRLLAGLAHWPHFEDRQGVFQLLCDFLLE